MKEGKRILLKVSGEALGGAAGQGLDREAVRRLCRECLDAARRGHQTAVVMGGGNFLRGRMIEGTGIARATGDQMGMLATVMNGLALRDTLEELGGEAALFSALEIPGAVMRFNRRRCLERMAQGAIALLAGGTGSPYFTTDTAAALRASELGADLLLKATKVDGVFEEDPKKNPKARRFDKLSYMEVITRRLQVMDATAVALCMENKIPIAVFDMTVEGNLGRFLDGDKIGTLIS